MLKVKNINLTFNNTYVNFLICLSNLKWGRMFPIKITLVAFIFFYSMEKFKDVLNGAKFFFPYFRLFKKTDKLPFNPLVPNGPIYAARDLSNKPEYFRFFNLTTHNRYNFYLSQFNARIFYFSNTAHNSVFWYLSFIDVKIKEKKKIWKFLTTLWTVTLNYLKVYLFFISFNNFFLFLLKIFNYNMSKKKTLISYNFSNVSTFYDLRASSIRNLLLFNSNFI